MKRCLADVNVLLPLLVRHHEHHELALRWFDGLAPGEAAQGARLLGFSLLATRFASKRPFREMRSGNRGPTYRLVGSRTMTTFPFLCPASTYR